MTTRNPNKPVRVDVFDTPGGEVIHTRYFNLRRSGAREDFLGLVNRATLNGQGVQIEPLTPLPRAS